MNKLILAIPVALMFAAPAVSGEKIQLTEEQLQYNRASIAR